MWDTEDEYYTIYNAYVGSCEIENREQAFANTPDNRAINPSSVYVNKKPEKVEEFEGSTVVECINCATTIDRPEDHFDFWMWKWLCENNDS